MNYEWYVMICDMNESWAGFIMITEFLPGLKTTNKAMGAVICSVVCSCTLSCILTPRSKDILQVQSVQYSTLVKDYLLISDYPHMLQAMQWQPQWLALWCLGSSVLFSSWLSTKRMSRGFLASEAVTMCKVLAGRLFLSSWIRLESNIISLHSLGLEMLR